MGESKRVYWLYLGAFVAGGIVLDWAFFDRVRNQIDMFWPVKDGFGYRDLLLPRAFVTIVATLIVGVGALEAQPQTWLIAIGTSLFLLSHLYAVYKVWCFGRRQ